MKYHIYFAKNSGNRTHTLWLAWISAFVNEGKYKKKKYIII